MNYASLLTAIRDAHQQAQSGAAGAVGRHLILRNWLIGAYLVEFEQNGEDRAQYATGLLKRVSADLRRHDIPGTSTQMLERTRLFYARYPQMRSAISSSLMRISFSSLSANDLEISSSPPVELAASRIQIGQSLIGESAAPQSSAPVVRKSLSVPTPLPTDMVLRLSWTHLLELIRLDDPWKRAFYENECLKGNWSVRQLQRQLGSLLYERTGLSTDKQAVIEHARRQAADAPLDIAGLIRDPYVLEFTGLAAHPRYLESDLETALLDHLQAFLLELGTGFCFEARQKRITVGNEHDYLDLVFYHRLLRCHLLIDLKTRAFQHTDAGQIHPVRYSPHARIPLRLRSAQSARRRILYRLHQRLEAKTRRAQIRSSALHEGPSSCRTGLLRGVPVSSRRHQAREVSQNGMGQTLLKSSPRGLSHGVNFYLNYWKENVMADGDQPPVGLLLCTDKDQTKVEYATGGLDHQLFVSRYLVALPKPEELQQLIETDRAVWEQRHPESPNKE